MACAPEQRHTQELFERLDLPRHGALGERQLLRGTGVALVPGGDFETGQGLGRGNIAAHAEQELENTESAANRPLAT